MKQKIIILSILLLTISKQTYSQDIRVVRITELEKIMNDSKTPLIINFWATWCKPCIEELPYFQEEVNVRKKDGLSLLLVSLDMDTSGLSSFISKRKITAPVVWLNETNADYFCPKVDASWSGAIPASLFLHPGKKYRKFHEEQLSREALKKEITALLD